MTFTGPGAPTLGGFQGFITGVMRVPPSALSPDDPVVGYAYNWALDTVNEQLAFVPSQPGAYSIYSRAVYNLAADLLINMAADAEGAPKFDAPGNDTSLPYWAYLRKQYGVLNFVAGVVQSTSDEGTSTGLLVPKAFENFTIANLQNLKTPYGRTYLGIAQSLGTLWGMS